MLPLRFPWPYGAVISLRSSPRSRFTRRSSWLHSSSLSVHLVLLYIGRLRLLRLRPSQEHAKRLGLPIM